MGCFNSKLAARSRSFRGDLRLSLQGRTNGIPVVEDLLSSKNGGDQFLALLCTANTVAMKLQAHEHEKLTGPLEEQASPKDQSSEPEVHETINAWELMADLEDESDVVDDKQQEQRQTGQEQDHKQTEGCSRIIVFESTDSKTSDESKLDLKDESLLAIEEALLDKRDAMGSESCSVETVLLHSEQELDFNHHREEETVSKTEEASSSADSDVPKMREIDCSMQSTTSSNRQSPGAQHEKGYRRRAMAKDLKPLKVPSFEFSRTRGLYHHGGGEDVLSPGSYVTPRFGNYLKSSKSHGRADGLSVFDVELAAHLEEEMGELSMEEEHILKQIVEDFLEHIQDSG